MRNKEDRTEVFESMPIGRAVLKLSVPTVLSCLVMVIYNLADTYFVGQLGNPVQNAAVTLVAPVILAFNAVNNLFGTGSSSLMSRALGLKDYDLVKRSSAFGIYMALFAGIFFSAGVLIFQKPLLGLLGAVDENMEATQEYLKWTVIFGAIPAILNVVVSFIVRAEGSALHAGIGTMSGCLLNIILDPIFILEDGLNMGASGAGLATFISNVVACLYFAVFLIVRKSRTYVCINPRYFRPDRKLVKDVFIVGVPAAVQNLLNVTGMAVLNRHMSGYGTEPVAAIGIAHKLAMVMMYVSMGISQGVMPLVGYNYSQKNTKRMRDAVRLTFFWSAAIMAAAAVLLILFPDFVVGLFMEEPLTRELGAAFLVGQALAQPFLAMDFLGVGVFQACGLGGRTLVFAILRKLVLEIPAIIILDRLVPMYGIPYAALVAEVILAAVSAVMLVKILRVKE